MKQGKRNIALVVLSCLFLFSIACGSAGNRTSQEHGAGETAGSMELNQYTFSEHFSYRPVEATYKATPYTLPLGQDLVADFDAIASKLDLDPQARQLLLGNGFVVTDFTLDRSCEDVVKAYKAIGSRRIPLLITSGSLLHAYHVLFDNALRLVEAQKLYENMWSLSNDLLTRCLEIHRRSDGELAEAAKRDAVLLAIGLSLLKPEREQIPAPVESRRPGAIEADDEFVSGDLEKYTFEVPDEIEEEVSKELDLIGRQQGLVPSPLFKYKEDYSQYGPRGHYTRSQKLRNYFKAMMWFGRMSMLLKGSSEVPVGGTCPTCDALISEYDARIQTLGAALLSSLMGSSGEPMRLWEETYIITSFFVGFSDDLGPYEYIEAMDTVFGRGFDLADFTSESHGKLKAKLAEYRSPLIYGGTGDCEITPPFTPGQADQCLARTRGFRLMGQRFVPDSYILSKMVAPYAGHFTGTGLPFTAYAVPGVGVVRVLPRGLDVMAVLGSERALTILDRIGDSHYEGFDQAFGDIKQELDEMEDGDWNQNLYWNWLWVLKALIGQTGQGFPTFMQTDAWRDRLLTLALASWSELRHDTVLYVKQSYTMALTGAPMPESPKGYVEPVPEVYNRLLSLTRMTRSGLEKMRVIDDKQAGRFRRMEDTLERLLAISVKEVQGEALDQEDIRFINRFEDTIEAVLGDLDERSRKTVLVADVHTDTNSGMVLEEACGYVKLILIAWKGQDGISLAAGPELSYYEFKQPMGDRLSDEAWAGMLKANPPPAPSWITSFNSGSEPGN